MPLDDSQKAVLEDFQQSVMDLLQNETLRPAILLGMGVFAATWGLNEELVLLKEKHGLFTVPEQKATRADSLVDLIVHRVMENTAGGLHGKTEPEREAGETPNEEVSSPAQERTREQGDQSSTRETDKNTERD